METGSIILDFIIILLIVVPIGFLVINSFNSERTTREKFNSVCAINNLQISHFEINGDLVLGIDEKKRKLVYSKRKDIMGQLQIINLTEISDCHIKTIKKSKNIMDWVGLELCGPENKKEIAFYNEHDDDGPAIYPEVCLQTAIKWEKLIVPLLKAS